MCLTSFSKVDDAMMTSSSQNKGIHVYYSTPTNKDPPEGKSTVVIAVMRGKPKDGYHHHCSNKHYKQKLLPVLLDSGSDGNLVFVSKDKLILLPYLKWLVQQLWNFLNGIFQNKCKARVDLKCLNILIAKGSIQNLMWLSTRRVVGCSMTSFLVQKPWKS